MSGFAFNPGSSSGGTPADNSVTSAKIVDGAIVNADINASAAIAASKLDGTLAPLASPTFTGTVTLPTGAVTSTMILDGTILDADVNASAAIAKTKISGTAITAADTGTVTSTMITDATIATGDIANNAITTALLASGIPQSLTSSGSSTKAVADTSAHVIGGAPGWNGTGWIGIGPRRYYANGSNANMAETCSRAEITSTTQTLATTGIMSSFGIELYAGQVITNLSFRTGGTAGSAMTHWWVALYDTQATPALIAQSADQTSAAIAASTNFTLALGSPAPYTVVTTGLHYVAIMVAATTIPTMAGSNVVAGLNTGIASGQKSLGLSSGSALTTTAPSTITSSSNFASLPYFVTS